MAAERAPAAMAGVEVRYEDDHLAVVSKPAGIVVHRGPGDTRTTLVEILGKAMPLAGAAGQGRPGIVHRLDKETSGLLIVAKTDEALQALHKAMKSRSIKREYLALVRGTFSLPTGRIEAPLKRSAKDPTRMAVISSGKPSVTTFQVLEKLEGLSLLRVGLETGRMHQIRAHFAHLGHPVIADPVYGRATLKLAGELGLFRPFLHAAHLAFEHPLSGQRVELTEPLPHELENALAQARGIQG